MFNVNPPALDDFENENFRINGRYLVNLGRNQFSIISNFITATTGVVVDSFSFVFVAYVDPNGDSYVIGVSVLSCYRSRLVKFANVLMSYVKSSSMQILL